MDLNWILNILTSPWLSLLFLPLIGYFCWHNVYDYNDLADCVDAIDTNNGTIFITEPTDVTDDLTIPANVTLRFIHGGTLNVSAGKTVTINGFIEAPPVEIFEGTGTAVVNTYPQDQAWWDNTQRGDRGPTFFYGDIYTDRWLELDTNTFVGVGVVGAGNLSAGAINNTAVGNDALNANTTGMWNVAIGFGALKANTTGSYNVGVGGNTLVNIGSGASNTAVGTAALHAVTTGSFNVGVGDNAGYSLTTGVQNIIIGYNAGYGATPANAPLTDLYGILIGYLANRSVASANQLENYIGIGYGVLIDKDNQTKIGNDATVECYLRGSMLLDLASVPAHANNAAAAGGGVAVGGFYRTNADPSVLCIRSA